MINGVVGFQTAGRKLLSLSADDGHPDGIGVGVLRFVRQLVKDGAVASAAERAAELRVVEDDLTYGDPDAILSLGEVALPATGGVSQAAWAYVIDFDAEELVAYRMWREVLRFSFYGLPSDEAFLTHLGQYV